MSAGAEPAGASEAGRKRLPASAFKKGHHIGRPKGSRDRRRVAGQAAAAALEAKAWDVVEKLLECRTWRARHEAAKTVLAYALGLPRQTVTLAGGFGDLSRELSLALQEARARRAQLEAVPVVAALPAIEAEVVREGEES